MTKSTITRERIELIANFQRAMTQPPSHAEIEELARMALAAMDSEPVAYIFKHPAGRLFWSLTDKSNKGHDDVMPVYASPQPAPIVSAELLHTAASAIEDLLTTKDRTGACVWFDLPFRLRSAANAQPAPVVPVVPDFKKLARELVDNLVDCGGLDEGVKEKYLEWAEKTCRAAMLNGGKP